MDGDTANKKRDFDGGSKADIARKYKKRSQSAEIWRRFRKNKSAVIGLVVVILIILIAIFADVIVDYQQLAIKINPAERLEPPSLKHLFGTDEFGRDMLARVIHGSRPSLLVGFLSSAISLGLGTIIGAIAGFYGSRIDNFFMRFMDILLALPSSVLAIAIISGLGSSLPNLMLAIGISFLPQYARIVRASVLTIKDQEFVEAARAIGARNHTIIFSHILPNCVAPIIVQATLSVAFSILAIAGLSFIGLGIKPPAPEWGALLSAGRSYFLQAPYITVFPGLAIMVTILALNLLGDGLRDALDPRLKQ